ncbi:phage tail protein [Acinetobacter modestus]|uniref:phage tail-collar fiber domain-containing protein n=1 Tax=Acinetobacter modestus TaxID=1776740 RepID=UPI001F4ACF6C|nr:phage tail protein [Acinetobacter modestus]MCH7387671.1 phage tail protein [Acinetobacter modestus]
MQYKSIHTKYGLQQLAQAESTGTQIRLTHMAVGDGAGYPITLDKNMTQLVRERFRAVVNRVYQDPENELKFTAELIIPVSVGGFVMREIGIFDSNGNLFAVGNLPDITKPMATDGLFTDTVFRIPFFVNNAENIELKIDPNVVVATHSWIINTINTAKLLPGGTTGQVLKKSSNIDGDVEWVNQAEADIFVDSIEEEQILATNQTHVTWSTLTTTGLAIYIDGRRLHHAAGADNWIANSATESILGKSYPAGTKILGIQNEPLGSAPYPLAKEQNLVDVPNKALARQNLNVFSKDETKANGLPPGAIVYFAMNRAPTGYLKANGAAISRTAYPELFAEIGTIYGAGDGVLTFNLPDGRAEFPRGLDDGRGIDVGRTIGSKQLATSVLMGDPSATATALVTLYNNKDNNSETIQTALNGEVSTANSTNLNVLSGSGNFDPSTVQAVTMSVRPRNIAWLCCIKY